MGESKCGYGDYNYHPAVVIGCYRPDTGKFHLEFAAYTDSIGVFSEIGGRLYVPHIDPVHYEDFKGLRFFSDGAWRNMAPFGMLHVYDKAILRSGQRWRG